MIDELVLRENGLIEEETSEQTATTEQTTEEVASTEQPTAETTTTEEGINTTEETVTEQVEEKPSKVKVEYKSWLEENEKNLFTYLKEKNTDYGSLDADKLAELKIRKDNPNLSDADVKAELAERYGIGQQKLSENIEDYNDLDEDEAKELVKEAKAHNKELDKLARNLRKDAPTYAKEFEEGKGSITLPDFEMELPNVEKAKPEEIVDVFLQEQEKQQKEHTEKVWQPLVKKEVSELSEITTDITIQNGDNKEVITVKYSLSEEDKKAFEDKMNGYVSDEYDNRVYVNEKGEADFKKFFHSKAKEMYVDKIVAVAVREATTKLKTDIYKKEFVNYTDEVRDVAPSGQKDDIENYLLNRQRN